MTRKEAAVFLSVTAHTIDNYKKQKKLPVFYLGDKPRFKKSDLLKLLIAPIQNN
jgi:excisionase family DNA binding protein